MMSADATSVDAMPVDKFCWMLDAADMPSIAIKVDAAKDEEASDFFAWFSKVPDQTMIDTDDVDDTNNIVDLFFAQEPVLKPVPALVSPPAPALVPLPDAPLVPALVPAPAIIIDLCDDVVVGIVIDLCDDVEDVVVGIVIDISDDDEAMVMD